jgi:hypothetical protein
MALSEAQRVQIRFYLGWSARFHQFDSRLEQALNAVETLADTQTQIEAVLTDLDDIVTKLKASYDRIRAMKVASIELPGKLEIGLLRSEGRRNVGSLAAILGVEVRHDIFSAGSYRYFATHSGLIVGGGNTMLQG